MLGLPRLWMIGLAAGLVSLVAGTIFFLHQRSVSLAEEAERLRGDLDTAQTLLAASEARLEAKRAEVESLSRILTARQEERRWQEQQFKTFNSTLETLTHAQPEAPTDCTALNGVVPDDLYDLLLSAATAARGRDGDRADRASRGDGDAVLDSADP